MLVSVQALGHNGNKELSFLSLTQMTTLEQVGEEVVGQARCPFESGQSNLGLFAGERLNL